MIERAILANMSLAIQRKDIGQLDKARQLLDIVKNESFSDYSDNLSIMDQPELRRARMEEAKTTLRELGLTSNGATIGIAERFSRGFISTTNPSHLTDKELLRARNIGKVKLAEIRQRFPYLGNASTPQG